MTIKDLIDALQLQLLTPELDTQRTVTSGYVGDLLSWVMGKAPPNGIWITIMSNINVAAVAALSDVSCVLLAESVLPDEQLKAKAIQEEIILLSSPLSSFDLAYEVKKLLKQ